MDDKWIENIREKMSEFEMTPPEGLWDSVQKQLKIRKARRRRVLGTAIAASVALIVGFFFAYIPEKTERPKSPVLLSSVEKHELEHEGIKQSIKENKILTQEVSMHKHSKISTNHQSSTFTNINETVSASESRVLQEYDNNMNEPNFALDLDEGENATEKNSFEKTNVSEDKLYVYVEPKDHSYKSHFSVSLSASANGIGGYINDNNFTVRPNTQPTTGDLPQTRMGGGILSDMLNSPSTPEPTPMEVFDHKLPLRFSVSLSFPIYKNLNIETGIVYSFLKSEIRYGDFLSGIWNGNQKLHFLGVPIGARYTPFKFQRLDIYTTGGAMMEKCIAGSLKEDRSSGISYSYPGCKERPFQICLNAAVGIQYNIAKELGIYLEPGLGFYLKNGSKLHTIYGKRPVTFNLNIGIRFTHP